MFRSLTIYQLTIPAADFLERLPDALQSRLFKPCGEKVQKSEGWVPALGGDSTDLIYTANGGTLMRLRTDYKEVPGSWIKEQVTDARRRNEAAGKEFTKTDEQLAREAAVDSALPDTRPSISHAFAYLDHELSMLFVARTGEAADEFTSALGISLAGAPPLSLLGHEYDPDPCITFTKWVQDTSLLGEKFEVGRKGDIKHAGQEGGCGMINIKQEDLDSEEIVHLLEAGRQVCSVALEHEKFSFRLRADLGFRNIELSKQMKAEGFDEESGGVSLANQFASFVYAMRYVINDLEPLLGGWPKQEMLDLRDQAPEQKKAAA